MSKATAPHPAAKDLRKAIEAKSSPGLMLALWKIREFYPERPFTKLPPVLRVIHLVTDLEVGHQYDFGVGSLLSDDDEPDVGAFVPEAGKWLGEIGAASTAEYLGRAAALFPNGQVARTPIKRAWQLEAIEERTPDAFEKLDREFRKWRAEVRVPLQRYLKAEEGKILAMLRPSLPEPPPPPTPEELLAITDPWDCLDALATESDRRMLQLGKREIKQRPEAAQMIAVLQDIGTYAGHGNGMWRFLDRDHIRDELDRAERWCVQIGAADAVAYFREYRKAFPDGQIPKGFMKRTAILERDEARFTRIDEKHARALEKMSRRLRTYLRANPKVVQSALGIDAAPKPAAAKRRQASK